MTAQQRSIDMWSASRRSTKFHEERYWVATTASTAVMMSSPTHGEVVFNEVDLRSHQVRRFVVVPIPISDVGTTASDGDRVWLHTSGGIIEASLSSGSYFPILRWPRDSSVWTLFTVLEDGRMYRVIRPKQAVPGAPPVPETLHFYSRDVEWLELVQPTGEAHLVAPLGIAAQDIIHTSEQIWVANGYVSIDDDGYDIQTVVQEALTTSVACVNLRSHQVEEQYRVAGFPRRLAAVGEDVYVLAARFNDGCLTKISRWGGVRQLASFSQEPLDMFVEGDVIWVLTGWIGHMHVRKIDAATGEVLATFPIPKQPIQAPAHVASIGGEVVILLRDGIESFTDPLGSARHRDSAMTTRAPELSGTRPLSTGDRRRVIAIVRRLLANHGVDDAWTASTKRALAALSTDDCEDMPDDELGALWYGLASASGEPDLTTAALSHLWQTQFELPTHVDLAAWIVQQLASDGRYPDELTRARSLHSSLVARFGS